jgi:hypothetical protein
MRDLALSFRGQDIQQQNLNLRILTVRVSNKGSVDILQGQYDQDGTWGITVAPGQIIEVRLGATNSPYLASRIDPELTSQNTITLKKVIFERDKYVTLDILVLHHRDSPPRISSFGKIAGLDEIAVADASAPRGRSGFWSLVATGTPLVHFVRLFINLLSLIALVFVIKGITTVVVKIQKGRRRRHISSVIAASSKDADAKAVQVFKECYVKNGIEGLSQIQAVLKDDKALRRALARRKDVQFVERNPQIVEEVFTTPEGNVVRRNRPFFRFGLPRAVYALADEGFVKLSPEGNAEVDPKVLEGLDELARLLK